MSWRDCAASIRTAAGRDLTDDQVSDIFEAVQRRQRAIVAAGKLDDIDGRLTAAVAEDANLIAIEAALTRKHAALSVIARDRVSRQIERHVAAGLSYRKAVLAIFEGTTRGVEGGRNSVGATKLAYEAEFVGGMMARASREVPHVEKMLRDRGFLDDVVREMVELREGGTPGRTGNTDARKVARVFSDSAEGARLRLNELGANIGKLEGWAGSQIHNADRIAKMTPEAWTDAILPKLDLARTFPDLATEADARRALGNVWENIVFSPDRASAPADRTGFSPPRNVARALERHRVLHFKSADDWLHYNRDFGEGHIFDGMIGHQNRAALNASQMEVLGPNPGATMQAVLDVAKRAVDRDENIPPASKMSVKSALTDAEGTAVGSAFRIASGAAMIPRSEKMAMWGSSLRALESMSKLGGAVISSITDLPTAIVNLRFNGMTFGQAVRGQMGGLFEGRGRGEQREIAYLLGEGFDGIIGHIVSPYVAADSAPGAIQSVMTTFFRWSGLTLWTDANRAASARVLSAHLGQNVGKGFDGLDPRLQNVLRQHDITPAMWDVARAEGIHRAENGNTYLIPDGITDRNTQLAFRRYYADEAQSSVLETGASTQRLGLWNTGLQRGTPAGEIMRFMMQFKAFPIAFGERVMGRAYQGGEGGTSAGAAHVGSLIAGLLIMGYAAMSAKDAIRGYEPRAFYDDAGFHPKTLFAAILQSGGAGIYGDFLFGEASRSGNSVLENLNGPAASDLSRWVSLYQRARFGEASAGAALTQLMAETPFLNVFYARPVLDYLIINSLRERLSPGYLARQDQRRRQDFGQDPFVPPTSRMAPSLF